MKIDNESPSIVLKDGKPSAVIIDIDKYRERLEDAEDLRLLEEMRKTPLSFRKLEDFLVEEGINV